MLNKSLHSKLQGFVPGAGRDSAIPGTSSGAGSGGDTTGMTPEQIEAAQAEREAAGDTGTMVNSRLAGAVVDGLITLLQSK